MLQSVAPAVWTCPVPLSFGGLQFGGRMTVINLGGELLVHSPVAPDAALLQEVKALGDLRWLVAPNDFHHLHIGAWSKAFPKAEVWTSTGVPKKQAALSPKGILEPGAKPGWGPELQWLKLEGMPSVNEVLLFHTPSQSLIATDFMFKLAGRGGLTWLFAKANGVDPQARQTLFFRFNIKDRAAYLRSAEPMKSWEVERISLTHNDLVETGGKALISETLGWSG